MYLGIDIGKADFHCALLLEEKVATKSFPNNGKGFNQLAAWLRNRRVEHESSPRVAVNSVRSQRRLGRLLSVGGYIASALFVPFVVVGHLQVASFLPAFVYVQE